MTKIFLAVAGAGLGFIGSHHFMETLNEVTIHREMGAMIAFACAGGAIGMRIGEVVDRYLDPIEGPSDQYRQKKEIAFYTLALATASSFFTAASIITPELNTAEFVQFSDYRAGALKQACNVVAGCVTAASVYVGGKHLMPKAPQV